MQRYILPLMLAFRPRHVMAVRASVRRIPKATRATKQLVEVSPGVYAIANYDEPVFFADNFYCGSTATPGIGRPTTIEAGSTRGRPRRCSPSIGRIRYAHYRPTVRDRVVIRDHRGNLRRR